MKNKTNMDFSDFIKYVPKIEKETLLSFDAHLKMIPADRINSYVQETPEIFNPKRAAVLMLLYPKKSKTHIALIIRNSYTGVHSSQIAFPGGKVELEDLSLMHTALRETHEEIGIHPDKIKVVKAFSEVYIPPSNFLVAPFLGICHSELEFQLQIEEVAGIIEFPLSDLISDATVVQKKITTSYANDIDVPTFKIGDYHVWGATAMMMSELKEVLKKVF